MTHALRDGRLWMATHSVFPNILKGIIPILLIIASFFQSRYAHLSQNSVLLVYSILLVLVFKEIMSILRFGQIMVHMGGSI